MNTIIAELLQNQRNQRFEESGQMNLGQLIKALEEIAKKHPDKSVRFDFGNMTPVSFSSWRGAYEELAIEYSDGENEPTVNQFLDMCKQANGKTFIGWKGEKFIMSDETPIWVANRGRSGNTALMGVEFCNWIVVLHTAWKEYYFW